MPIKSKERKAKRKKKWGIIVAVVVVFLVIGFLHFRQADLRAWPAPVEGVSLAPRDASGELTTPEDVAELVAMWSDASPELIAEYRDFQINGLANGKTYPLIEARITDNEKFLAAWDALWKNFVAFDASQGAMPYNRLVAISAEITILKNYEAAKKFHETGDVAESFSYWKSTLIYSAKMTRGGGLISLVAAANNIMSVSREIIMAVNSAERTEHDIEDVLRLIQELRRYENELAPLADAFRADLVSLHRAIDEVYDVLENKTTDNASELKIGGMSKWVITRLGATRGQTRANIDALFSVLIANAEKPYSPDALAEVLPGWCTGNGRAPWTRDPIGASFATSYMRNAANALAAKPSIQMELRAARIALALDITKAASPDNAFPESLEELVASGTLPRADLIDPFATEPESGIRFVYERDGDGWRFYSVGWNQQDDGGVVDAYRSPNAKMSRETDVVFISRERDSRAALNPPPATQTQAKKTSNADEK